jgi:hypothetical protein
LREPALTLTLSLRKRIGEARHREDGTEVWLTMSSTAWPVPGYLGLFLVCFPSGFLFPSGSRTAARRQLAAVCSREGASYRGAFTIFRIQGKK